VPAHVLHETFSLSRTLAGSAREVFALFEQTPRWRRWFRMPGADASYQHDFRVGGGDLARSTFAHLDGRAEALENRSAYLVIEPDTRIVFSYVSLVGDVARWTSLVTVELDQVSDASTELRWTEQVAFTARSADPSHDLPHLRGAVQMRLTALAIALEDE
jgi:uncharacterized protein YndB with AHSA1/START domain